MTGKTKVQGDFHSKINLYPANALKANSPGAGAPCDRQQPTNASIMTVSKVVALLLRWRWPLMALLGLSVIILEVGEHYGFNPASFYLPELDLAFAVEVLFYGLILPMIGGIILGLLERIHSDRLRAAHRLDRQQELNRQLINILNWKELMGLLVGFPRTIAPFTGISLLVSNQDRTKLELAAEWRDPDDKTAPASVSFLPADFCRHCVAEQSSFLCSLGPDRCPDNVHLPYRGNGYCMLLPYHDQPAALLHFYLPPDSSLTSHQVEVLSGLAPSITLGLNSVRPQGEAIAQATATDAERRRIARHLHDNLGQNLSYLRFKLDQLSGDDARGEIVAVRQELEHMRDTANEAYEQVRDTLASLHPAGSGDLATALLAQARAVGRQVNFKVELTSEGQSRSLPPGVQRQALYLFREALINVGKHANAGQVGIDLMWAADTLTIKLADDGQGFEPDAPRVDGHYGLAIMHERAEEINGALTLASRPDAGTKVTLRLPLS